jgi:hypothetical protein
LLRWEMRVDADGHLSLLRRAKRKSRTGEWASFHT